MKTDSWGATISDLYLLNKQLHSLFEREPKKDTPEKKIWDAELKGIRALFVTIHERRIGLNLRDLKNRAIEVKTFATTRTEIKFWRRRGDGLHTLVRSETNYDQMESGG